MENNSKLSRDRRDEIMKKLKEIQEREEQNRSLDKQFKDLNVMQDSQEIQISPDLKKDIISPSQKQQQQQQLLDIEEGGSEANLEQSEYKNWDQMLDQENNQFQKQFTSVEIQNYEDEKNQRVQESRLATKQTIDKIKEKLMDSLNKNKQINEKFNESMRELEQKHIEQDQEQLENLEKGIRQQNEVVNKVKANFQKKHQTNQQKSPTVRQIMFNNEFQIKKFSPNNQNERSRNIEKEQEYNNYRSRSVDEERPFLDIEKEIQKNQNNFQENNQNQNESPTATYRGIIMKEFLERQRQHKECPEKQFCRKTENEYLQEQKFPFKPEVHQIPREIYQKEIQISKEEQWERLFKTKIEVFQEREIMKLEIEAEEMSVQCPFKPRLNPTTIQITQRSKSAERVEERLYRSGVEKKLNDEIQSRQKQEEIFQQFPFQPKINVQLKGEKGANWRPLYERVEEVLEQKKQVMRNLKSDLDEKNQSTFKPAVNQRSLQLVQQKLQSQFQENVSEDQKLGGTVFERLMEDAMKKVERKLKLQEDFQQEQSQQCPFQPSVNRFTSLGSENVDAIQASERQYLMADVLREKLEQKVRESMAGLTFRPEINKVSEYLMEADQTRCNENLQQKMERLAQKDQEKRELIKEQIQKAYYEQFSFQPELNPTSKALAKDHQIEDSLQQYKIQQEQKKQQALKRLEQEVKECSFQPKTNKKKQFQHLTSNYKYQKEMNEKLVEQETKRKKKLEQLKSMKEYDELKECTFKPFTNQNDISKNLMPDQLIVEVRGIDKFLEMKDKKRRQEMEIKERENQVFCIEKKYDQNKHETHTVPQPFKLSKGSQKSFQLLREEVQRQEKENCTFHPKTNESKNKAIIRQILSENTEAFSYRNVQEQTQNNQIQTYSTQFPFSKQNLSNQQFSLSQNQQ